MAHALQHLNAWLEREAVAADRVTVLDDPTTEPFMPCGHCLPRRGSRLCALQQQHGAMASADSRR